jgi:hypothetical protein
MKYYIGHLFIFDDGSNREYTRHVCIAAANPEAAQRALQDFAAEWDSDGAEYDGQWRYGEPGAYYRVMPASELREISAATFDEVSQSLTALGDVRKVTLDDKEPAAAVKAVCHRLSEQLVKRGIEVPSAKLLEAASAALGGTGWAQLKARVSGEPSALPKGTPKQQPLRKARDVDFAARVDAVWLADGDVALAARLLHVDGVDLLGSFSASESDVAFSSRPTNWKPEHSLARDYGILADADFKVVTEHRYPGHTQVTGWVNGRDAIGFNDHISGKWHITGVTAPYGDLSEVRQQLACYYETLRQSVEAQRKSATIR